MNSDAGIYDDLIITKIENGFLIILNAACKESDFEILSKLLNNKYEMVLDEKRSLIAIQGPKSVEILNNVKGVFTNTPAIDAYRGAGRPEASFVIERLVDVAGMKTGLGPIEIEKYLQLKANKNKSVVAA